MKKENLFKSWLDHSLSEDERESLKNDERFRAYETITQAAQYFRAPEFNASSSYGQLTQLQQKQQQTKVRRLSWPKIAASIAAILVLAFLVNNLLFSGQINYVTGIAEELAVVLPDNSKVTLSAGSTLTYNEDTWSEQREVTLNGEAYFEVAQGQQFDVTTPNGVVTVTGTAFNVVHRENYFAVSCFEGSVTVSLKDKKYHNLEAGDILRMVDGDLAIEKTASLKPDWILNKSVFKSTPLRIILAELERQYQVKINAKDVDKNIIFTGSFTHEDLETAMQAISIPLGLTYTVQEKEVLLENNK